MPPERLKEELRRAGRLITRWQVELLSVFSASAILALLWLFSLSDIFFQYRRTGRVVIWVFLVGLLVSALTYIVRLLLEKHPVMGIAARLELAFPELDNHLINFLQFSANPGNDPFKKAYVRRGVPQWSGIELPRMKNRRAHMRANIALAAVVLLMASPIVFRGQAWAVAVARIVNPFSNTQPSSLTRILEVKPGDSSALQGSPAVVSCRVAGVDGHKVHVDIKPSDDKKTSYLIGRVSGAGEELFSYKIPKVTTDIRYRFRAGDSPPTRWHSIDAHAPLAVTGIRLDVRPPACTGIAEQTFDGMSSDVSIPQDSSVTVRLTCNSSLKSATVMSKGGKPVGLLELERDNAWVGTLGVDAGDSLEINAIGESDEKLKYTVSYVLVEDTPPAIIILAPQGKSILPPGTIPEIEFTVRDDYGLAGVSIERMRTGGTEEAEPGVVRTWKLDAPEFSTRWRDEDQRSSGTQTMAFRIVAKDNRTHEQHEVRSPPILFSAVSMDRTGQVQDSLKENADAAIAAIIRIQKENIETTRRYIRILDTVAAERWPELAGKQKEIRRITKKVLTNPLRPLGNLTASVKKAYMNEMSFVIDELVRIPVEVPAARPTVAASALQMEEKILRYLTYADAASEQARVEQKTSVLDGLLKALIDGESDLIGKTRQYLRGEAKVSELLVDKQDYLASDLAEFVRACGSAASLIRSNEPDLAAAYERAGASCEEKKIREDMMLSAEKLDRSRAAEALPFQNSALAKLEQIQQDLTELKAAGQEKKQEEMLEVLGEATARIGKIKEIHKKALESMEIVKANKNLDTKELDMLEEEYEELLKKTKDAMLEVPTDLHIFQELNCANDVVEDVITIFQECEQEEDSEDDLQEGKVTEMAFSKDDSLALLEALEEAEERIDDFEMWLGEKPDTEKVTVEAMDQEEMPDEGAALGALETKVEDIISDLLEESEDPDDKEKADDGAINRAVGDMEMGAEVIEGDITSFAAKGKSGNEAPDHKEQDGRSNVGRQGMSSGETAAGSGTIQEGDKNIEKRRTQDPTQSGQVDAEGEADTQASGGGKQGTGRADDIGDGKGGTQRMDSNMEGGGAEGMAALMADLDRMYDQASMKNVRAPSLKLAAHHVRQAADAIADARSIDQVEELKRRAVAALRKAQTELGGDSTAALDTGSASSMLKDVVEGGSDDAPPRYRGLVNEYYRALNDEI